MRKRAQRKSKPAYEEPKHKQVSTKIKTKKEEKPTRFIKKKNWWISISLLGIFLLILFLNSYYAIDTEIAINPEGEGFDKFYYSGPDPYYNVRLVEETYETGRYPFYSEDDPLLNYPLGRSGARAPLFNMMSIGFSRLLTPFMNEIDAIGYSMQFIPALFGALIIIPVYFIGKEIFNKKAGLIGALFVALIPIHLGSGHGSAFSLFDHDSFNLLLYFITFYFLIKSIKEKNSVKSVLYAVLGGVPLAALSMTWVSAQYLYVIITIYAIVQMFIDILRSKIEFSIFRTTSVLMFTGYLISLPISLARYGGFRPEVTLYLCLIVTIFGAVYYLFGRSKIPWTISMPAVIFIAVLGFVILHPAVLEMISSNISGLGPLNKISDLIYGLGIYGNKVSLTIAEANTYQISNSIMSFGPTLYWLGWTGLIFVMYYFYKDPNRRDYLFILTFFIVSIWLTGIAGRFTNDMVPVIAMLAGWIIWLILERIDYRQMLRNIKSAGGGLHGIRRGISFLHIFGILFVAFLVLLPNAFMAFDAAVPVNAITDDGESDLKTDMFGEGHSAAFGLGIGKEKYWSDAFQWLSEQDQDIKNPADRPAFISWWDYGFYAAAMSEHPTVADNFQDGIPPASNFHTATSEKEAVSVWIVRLLEGDVYKNKGKLSSDLKTILVNHLDPDENNSVNSSKVIKWIENPESAPSFDKAIQGEYHKYIQEDVTEQHLYVGSQWPENAAYHDIVDLLTNDTTGLSDEEITMLYHALQEETGWSIRYYGVEGYDKQIFNIFAFLSDKSLLMLGAPKDEFIEIVYTGYWVDDPSDPDSPKTPQQWKAIDLYEMDDERKRHIVVENQYPNYFDSYSNTMFYKTYFGPSDQLFKNQVPCVDMKHFYAEYMSDLSKPHSQYYSGIAAVVIAKYYEGAYVNGTLVFNDSTTTSVIDTQVAITKDLAYTKDVSIPIDHDKMNATNGYFKLLAGANTTLQIRRYPELIQQGANAFVMKEIDLEISDEDAMRKSGEENWNIDLGNITINPANVSGFVYENMDNNESFNPDVDKTILNATVDVFGINKLQVNKDGQGNIIGISPAADDQGSVMWDFSMMKQKETDENGSYNFSYFKPGYYYHITSIDDIPIDRRLIPLDAGNTSINVTKPKSANIKGKVYYEDLEGSNTTISDANVSIFYGEKLVKYTTTTSNGSYEFMDLIPGTIKGTNINEYIITVDKKVDDKPIYQAEVTISPEENKTTTFNIPCELAPVNVSGFTKAVTNDTAIGNVEILFEKDETVQYNTAETNSAMSNETTGSYSINLKPGFYNVSAEQMIADTVVYEYIGKLDVGEGIGEKPYEIKLNKKTVTLKGTVKDDETGKLAEGVTVTYTPDLSVENNTATTPSQPVTGNDGAYSIEIRPGFYNLTALKQDGSTLVYIYEETSLEITNSTTSKDILVDKKSVTLTGKAAYNAENKEDITIDFTIDHSKSNNSAVFTSAVTDETGHYTVEITPGTTEKPANYNISAFSNMFNISGVNYTYINTSSTGHITVTEDEIITGKTHNIELELKEQD